MNETPENEQPETPETQPKAATPQSDKVIGIPTDKYLKICYVLVLLASGFGILTSLVDLVGGSVPGAGIIGFLGLVGVVLTVLAWLVFNENFNALDLSHFKYVSLIFAGFFVLIIFFSAFVGSFLTFLTVAAEFFCLFIGYRVWGEGQEATKDNLINGFNTLKSSIKK